jgi:AraC-like DNA-binding protein
MNIDLVPMHDPSVPVLGGGHNSDGWDVDTPWHFHDMHQLLYAFAGSVDVEGELGSHRIPHQFAAWIPAGAVHRTRIQKVSSGSVFLSAELVPAAGDHVRVIRAPSLLREMVAHARRWPLGTQEDESSRAYFTCIAKLCPEWIDDEVQLVLPSCRDVRLEKVIELTRDEMATVTFGEVSRRTGFSERSLRRKFLAECGISWETYRRRLRILAAIELLDTTDRTVGVIAAEVGYENQAAFAKAFNNAVGTAPAGYRKLKRRVGP